MDGDLAATIAARYPTAEFPALAAQIRLWDRTRPLAGAHVLDVTPVYANTLPKYLALQAAGAAVTVSVHRGIPGDPAVIAGLPEFGIAVADEPALLSGYDVVLDCAGTHADVTSRDGYAELTRSGLHRYAGCTQPVVMVDSGVLKRIETTLGTGDGFVRAMAHLGQPVTADRSVTVIGGGKVGFGVAAACAAAGATVTIIDPLPVEVPTGAVRLDAADGAAVARAVASSWCVVSATGQRHGLASLAQVLRYSEALLANMGAEDEFGTDVPPERALNSKVPVNFVLAEPTRLRYLDPTMALSNAAAVELHARRIPAGVHAPAPALEQAILREVRDHGAVAAELDTVLAAPTYRRSVDR